MPLVSILIPAYNAEKWIEEAIKSALQQTWSNIEIIIVDDGSNDNTLAAAKKFKGSQVKVFKQENGGAAAARNKAFKESSGQYIQYLDADDVLAADKIEKQLRLLSKDAHEVVVASTWSMFVYSPGEISPTANPLFQDYHSPVDWLVTAWTEGVWMQPTAWLTPRKLIEAAGPWNESLSLHDDGEFFCRVLLKSKRILFCKEAHSFYRKGIATSLSSIKSVKAVQSHFLICQLYEQHLLQYEKSQRTMHACAANYQQFIYQHYPFFKEYLTEAATQVKRLGGSFVKPKGSPTFMLLKKFAGWRLARKIELLAYKRGFNRSNLKKAWQGLT